MADPESIPVAALAQDSDAHKVKVDVFDGPLDLLLYLIKKSEVDIHDIPIEKIADQYMEYLMLMKMLDLNIAGEFIVMAATLMLIKSRMLLPPEERPPLEEEEGDDPRWELVKQLIEYRKFKDAALFLGQREREQENIFAPGSLPGIDAQPDVSMGDVSLFDLISVFNQALKRLPPDDIFHTLKATYTVADKIESVLALLRDKDNMSFFSLVEKADSRQEIVCTFIAVLELIRLKQIKVTQESHFSEILVARVMEV